MAEETVRVYGYKGCDSCRKALRFLRERGVAAEMIPIREQPPTVKELARMLGITGNLKKLCNTSGQDYREPGMKERLAGMTETEALTLLAENGNLVKRPFLLLPDGRGATGFREEEWETLF